jgi:hypothetical protein
MKNIKEAYELHCGIPSDIFEHLPVLKKYGEKCKHITEMGVRSVVSTYAFLSANPEKLISYDIDYNENIETARRLAKAEKVNFNFIQADVLNIDIEKTDLLFIDTFHIYDQLKMELLLHSRKVNKYIILHDTTAYAQVGESAVYPVQDSVKHNYKGDDTGIWPAVLEFIQDNPEWIIELKLENNNGLTILARK